MAKFSYKIFIVEDDEGLQHLIQKKLNLEGFETVVFQNGQSIIDEKDKIASDTIILLDYLLPDFNGIQIVEKLKFEENNIPFITMTGHGDERVAVEMMKLGARDYLVKESNFIELLLPVINQTVKQLDLEKKLTEAVLSNREKDSLMMMQSRQASMGEMLSNISHQWSIPLKEIIDVVDSVKNDFLANEISKKSLNESVDYIHSTVDNLKKQIVNLQEFFKPETEKDYFYLDKAVTKAVSFINSVLNHYNIKIELFLEKDIKVFGFENEYIQVILNLLNNSKDILIKRKTKDPYIKIILKQKEKTSTLSIVDNAGGVNENMVNKIFDPYFTTKTHEEGSGLGLFISKSFIEKDMGGKLSARNIDDGMEFKIEVTYF